MDKGRSEERRNEARDQDLMIPLSAPRHVMDTEKTNVGIIRNADAADKAEAKYRLFPDSEIIPYARKTHYRELATSIIRDKDGPWAHPLYVFESRHITTIGVQLLMKKTKEFLESQQAEHPMDILSVSAGMTGSRLSVTGLVRVYREKPHFGDLYAYLGEFPDAGRPDTSANHLLPPKTVHTFTPEEQEAHRHAWDRQMTLYRAATYEHPFLNQISTFVPRRLSAVDDREELVYDLRTRDSQIQLNSSYDEFMQVFTECMQYLTSSEKDSYYNVLRGLSDKKSFFDVVEAYVQRTFIDTHRLPMEDEPQLLDKIDRALYDLYIVKDLIDDPLITDIKITDPWSVRVRVRGKAYLSNVTFIDMDDYARFINGIAVYNNIDLRLPVQTFTDEQDDRYILRFSITAPYITSTGFPVLHIRKLPRKKQMADDLIRAGMMDERIRDYLLDCGRFSRGVVFAGPPGSGKTTLLNWFLEDAYESSAEILCIQENDELFAYRKGVTFQHVVLNPQHGEQPCSMEQLAQMARVAGANVFIIGEVKGAEITSVITLSNSGCRTAMTIHSHSARDTVDQMTDLALRGSEQVTYDQAKRMIKSFQTIVYLQDFKVREIVEIVGYDETRKDFVYRDIYRSAEGPDRTPEPR